MSIGYSWRATLAKRLRDLLIRRHGWVYLLTVGLWIAATVAVRPATPLHPVV